MASKHFSLNLGLSDYAITAYLTLLDNHPINGSQLSRLSGIPRARAYEILRALTQRGFVAESGEGMYVPLPPDELIKRLRNGYEKDLAILEDMLKKPRQHAGDDFIWTIKGYGEVMAKAEEMVGSARQEVYTRLFPEEGRILDPLLKAAESRGGPGQVRRHGSTGRKIPAPGRASGPRNPGRDARGAEFRSGCRPE